MPYKNIEQRRKKGREYCQRPEIKARRKKYNKRRYHKCFDCDSLIVKKAKRCLSCSGKERKRIGYTLSEKHIKKLSERMKKKNPMKNPEIAKKVRDLNKKNGVYERHRIRMLNGGGKKAWESMIKKGNIRKEPEKTSMLTKELLSEEYVLNKKSIKTISTELNLHHQTINSRLKKFNIPLNKKERKIFGCIDCEKIISNYSIRCVGCNRKNIKKSNKKKIEELKKDPIFNFRQFITRINHLEHLRKIGFKKGITPVYEGDSLIRFRRGKFKKDHKRNVGKKHPNWRGGIQYEPYDNNFTEKFKEIIRQRDNYTCIKCDKPEYKELQEFKRGLAIHHINYDKKCTILENCCTLCLNCNFEVNYKRKHWTKFFQSLLSEKYGYNYSKEGEIILNVIMDSKNGK